MAHHLAMFPRHVGHSFLATEQLCVRRAIAEMLDFPSFMRRPVNSTCGRGLNAMLS